MDASPTRLLTIAEAAAHCGLTPHTLRYYERIGLLDAVPRAPGGQRRYAAADMDWLAFLMRLRATGMSIQGMQAFARLRSQGNASVTERRQLLEEHLADVERRMQALGQSARILAQKITHYAEIERSLSTGPAPQAKEAHGNRTLRTRTRQAEGNRR